MLQSVSSVLQVSSRVRVFLRALCSSHVSLLEFQYDTRTTLTNENDSHDRDGHIRDGQPGQQDRNDSPNLNDDQKKMCPVIAAPLTAVASCTRHEKL